MCWLIFLYYSKLEWFPLYLRRLYISPFPHRHQGFALVFVRSPENSSGVINALISYYTWFLCQESEGKKKKITRSCRAETIAVITVFFCFVFFFSSSGRHSNTSGFSESIWGFSMCKKGLLEKNSTQCQHSQTQEMKDTQENRNRNKKLRVSSNEVKLIMTAPFVQTCVAVSGNSMVAERGKSWCTQVDKTIHSIVFMPRKWADVLAAGQGHFS